MLATAPRVVDISFEGFDWSLSFCAGARWMLRICVGIQGGEDVEDHFIQSPRRKTVARVI